MGTPEFAVPCLKSLLDGGYQVVAVYTQPDRPAGRGQGFLASPVKRLAQEIGLKVVQPAALRQQSAVSELAALAPDLIAVAAYGLMLPRTVLDLPRWGCLNVHPSLLPSHRGPSPIAWGILDGDTVAGVTMMLMDAGMDTGPILEQRELPVADEDTALTLGHKLAALAATMLPATLERWVRGELKPQPQDNGRATYSRLITKADGEIDWRLPAVDLWRRTRAFQPWPGCYTRWHGRILKVVEAIPVLNLVAGPGEIIFLPPGVPKDCIVGAGTGSGVLGLLRIQLEGKKEVDAAEFIRGQRDFVGSRLALQ